MENDMTQEQWNWIFSYCYLLILLIAGCAVLWFFEAKYIWPMVFIAHHQAFTWNRRFPKRQAQS
jgi:ABC-type cobalamin transport system permease subunit